MAYGISYPFPCESRISYVSREPVPRDSPRHCHAWRFFFFIHNFQRFSLFFFSDAAKTYPCKYPPPLPIPLGKCDLSAVSWYNSWFSIRELMEETRIRNLNWNTHIFLFFSFFSFDGRLKIKIWRITGEGEGLILRSLYVFIILRFPLIGNFNFLGKLQSLKFIAWKSCCLCIVQLDRR